MLADRIEGKWIDLFADVFARCKVAPGDLNLTFKRYLESPVRLTIENDYVTKIEGDSFDAELMREYFAAWGDREAYAVSHVGWGMNTRARWDALAMYDKRDGKHVVRDGKLVD